MLALTTEKKNDKIFWLNITIVAIKKSDYCDVKFLVNEIAGIVAFIAVIV